MDLKQPRVEVARWWILVALEAGRPYPVSEDIILRALDDSLTRLTHFELRRELDYLENRKLIELSGKDRDRDHWEAELTALGLDVVEYTTECRPGIARPPRR